MEVIRANGLEIAYERVGRGPPLVLVHGAALDSRSWQPQLAALADEFTVVAWDEPGAGRSSDVPADFGLADYADCLAALIGALALGRAHVAGLSWGGTVVLELYRRHPELVATLVLVDTYAGWKGSLPEEEVRARLQGVHEMVEAPVEAFDPTLPGLFAGEPPAEFVPLLEQIAAAVRPHSLRTQLSLMAEADQRDLLPRIDVPVLLIWGEHDARSPLGVARQFEQAIPDTTLVVIPDAGHVSNLEQPEAFDDAVRRFCRDHRPQVQLRAPEPGDAPAVLELIVARDVADLGYPDYTIDDVEADWASHEVDLALDAWLAEDGDGLLGYALLDERGTVLVTVPPASEGRGVGTTLREAAEARAVARELGLIHQYVPASNEGARAHLRQAGYSPAYRYLRMRIDLAHAPEPPADVPVRTYIRGADDGPVHELVEAAMADVPGYRPQSLESWRAAKLDKEGWDPSLWLLHEDVDGLAGAALCERFDNGVGSVEYLAVASPSRGRGVGRALLLHGLAALRAAGLTVGELFVQAGNTGATRLYESVGMRPAWTSERWDKTLVGE